MEQDVSRNNFSTIKYLEKKNCLKKQNKPDNKLYYLSATKNISTAHLRHAAKFLIFR